MSITKNHPYHIVDPSPWPILGSVAAFILPVGIILWVRDWGPWTLFAGAFFLICVLWAWWRDVSFESMIPPGIHVHVDEA